MPPAAWRPLLGAARCARPDRPAGLAGLRRRDRRLGREAHRAGDHGSRQAAPQPGAPPALGPPAGAVGRSRPRQAARNSRRVPCAGRSEQLRLELAGETAERSPGRRGSSTALSRTRAVEHAAAAVERHRLLDPRVDLLHELHEVAHRAEMDVGRVVPAVGQVLGDRHAARQQKLRGGCASCRNSGTTRPPCARSAAAARARCADCASPAASGSG